jgi:hypothetical protein
MQSRAPSMRTSKGKRPVASKRAQHALLARWATEGRLLKNCTASVLATFPLKCLRLSVSQHDTSASPARQIQLAKGASLP